MELGNISPIVLIDGRAGSGKSTFAKELQEILFREGESLPRVIHMDDLYPGWEGLAEGSNYLERFILGPLTKGQTASWQEWDWQKNQRANWREFSGGTPLIIEGCGSISTRNAEVAFLKIWMEASFETRLRRWIEREGDDSMFEVWAAQELDFYSKENSQHLASLLVET